MNKQPEALRLADELAIQDQCDFYKVCEEAALELRWLYEENERLREALKESVELIETIWPLEGATVRKARRALQEKQR